MKDIILIPVAVLGGLGLVFGVLLAIAAKVFAVKTDERITAIAELLPGANCGGCGYSGCAQLAEAIAKGEASPNACSVGGNEVAGLPVGDELGCAADGGGDAVEAAGHGFLEGAGGAFGL